MNHAKKLLAGMAATVTHLETFPTVQNTLKSIGEGGAQGELAFLAGSAATAISILQTIQVSITTLSTHYIASSYMFCRISKIKISMANSSILRSMHAVWSI
jgi:hypothetical protein